MHLYNQFNNIPYNMNKLSDRINLVCFEKRKGTIVRYYRSIRDVNTGEIKDGIFMTRRYYDKMPSDFELLRRMAEDLWDNCVITINQWDSAISIVAGVAGIAILYYVYKNYKKRQVDNEDINKTRSKFREIDNQRSKPSNNKRDTSNHSDSDTDTEIS